MKITFLGTRGSTPTTAKNNTHFGTNTSCVCIDIKNKPLIIFDAGSGLPHLPPPSSNRSIIIILSHLHLDHIVGLPFFKALHNQTPVTICSAHPAFSKKNIQTILNPPFFPIQLKNYKNISIKNFSFIKKYLAKEQLTLSDFKTNHPGDAYAYSLQYKEKKLVYCTDNEYTKKQNTQLKDLFTNTDLLIHDCHFTNENHKKGWGHSNIDDIKTIIDTFVPEKLALFHHAPNHTDANIKKIEKQLEDLNAKTNCFAAFEGQEILF